MPRVLVISNDSWSVIPFRGELLIELKRRGNEVFVGAPKAPKNVLDELTQIGVRYRNVYFDRVGLNPVLDMRTFLELVRLIKEIKPNILIVYTIKPVLYGSIAGGLAGVKEIYSIITGLGYAFSKERLNDRIIGFIARKMYKWALSKNKKVFFQNPDDMILFNETHLIRGETKSVVVNGSGVSTSQYKLALYPEKPSFLLIARLLRPKGVSEFVAASNILKKKYPEATFRIVGKKVESPIAYNEEEIHDWVKQGAVEYLGELSDVRPAIADASVFVLPTYYREGTPRTILEAMAMGRPIITTHSPGCKETVCEGVNGYFVKEKDVKTLVEKMEIFIKKPNKVHKMGLMSRKIAEEKYDVKKVNQQIMEEMDLL